ncbi:NADH dehydrogenase [Corynebacterium caspium DSM 44850]|nr:NADH dehydrogenase [Corynebacterium caspium DSM 44850]
MLTVDEAIRSRRATRKYTDQVPSDEVIDQIAELALEAPSAFNAQRRDLVVVRDPNIKQKIFDASGQQQFLDAPVIFITVARAEVTQDDEESILGTEMTAGQTAWRSQQTPARLREDALKDATLVSGFLLIAAQAHGLATSPTTGWDEQKVKEAIGIGSREDRAISLVVAAGYPDENPANPGRAPQRRINDSYTS